MTHGFLFSILFCLCKNEDLASLAAQQYYVQYGADMTAERLQMLLPQYIPDSCLAGTGMKEKWLSMVRRAFTQVRNYW